jgi:hypothetical protein
MSADLLIYQLRCSLLAEGHSQQCPRMFGANVCACKTYATFDRIIAKQSLTMGVVERLTARLHATRMLHSCMTCIHFKEGTEICALYEERPPARVIAYGCPSWEDDTGEIMTEAQRLSAQTNGNVAPAEMLQTVVAQRVSLPIDTRPLGPHIGRG